MYSYPDTPPTDPDGSPRVGRLPDSLLCLSPPLQAASDPGQSECCPGSYTSTLGLQLAERRAKVLTPTVKQMLSYSNFRPLGACRRNPVPLLNSVLQSFLCLLFSWLSNTLTLQVCDFTVLLLLQLGIFLAMGLQCLPMFQFQAVVLQLQVKQLLLDIFMLVLNMDRSDKESIQGEEK